MYQLVKVPGMCSPIYFIYANYFLLKAVLTESFENNHQMVET